MSNSTNEISNDHTFSNDDNNHYHYCYIVNIIIIIITIVVVYIILATRKFACIVQPTDNNNIPL